MPEPFRAVTGPAAPLIENDINTDQVSPAGAERGTLHPDYAANLFRRRRERDDGSPDPGFVLNKPQFAAARILVAGDNFGCGSSRESAVWAMTAFGIRCIVARSFADIYRENCLKNGLLPVTLSPGDGASFEAKVIEADGLAPFTADLENQLVRCPDGTEFHFDIASGERTALLEGLDDIGVTLKHLDEIAAWERRTQGQKPWLQEARDSRR